MNNFIHFILVVLQIVDRPDNSINIIGPLLDALRSLGSSVVNGIASLLERIVEQFARGIAEGTGRLIQEAYTFSVDPIRPLAHEAYLFIAGITFALAQLSFIIALGMFVLPLNESVSARGRNGLFDSTFSVALLSFTPAINSFFQNFSEIISKSIIGSISTNIIAIVANILLSLATVVGVFFLILDAIALLFAATLVIVALLLSLLAPILFSLAVAVYSVPLQIAKNTSNRIFAQSVFLWFLAPIGYSVIALNITILSTVVSPLTPLVIVVFDYLVLRISFNIANEVGASYPILGTSQKLATNAIFFASLYLSKGSALVLSSARKSKGSDKEQEVE